MTEQMMQQPPPPVASIRSVLSQYEAEMGHDLTDRVEFALVEREAAVADYLREAATAFNLYPQIVAKVLMDAGMGRTVSDQERKLIDAGFAALMQQVREEWERRGE